MHESEGLADLFQFLHTLKNVELSFGIVDPVSLQVFLFSTSAANG